MVETKPTDQGDQQLKAKEVKPLASSDAQAVATPSAQDKQKAEAERTNQSSGSLTELAFKSRGLSREQVAAQMEAQGDSISIDYGNGQEASRKTGLSENELVQVGGKTYDAKTVVAYDNQGNSDIVSDATNATAVYETDKSKIVPKDVEVQPKQLIAGLDYNTENIPFSQKLAKFAQSAEARLMDPAARQAQYQGMIDKALGVCVGLNEVKDEIKDSAKMVAEKARTALEDGSVAAFMAKPNAINEPLFKAIGVCFDAMRKDPNAVNKVLSIMGRELEAANNKYTNMTPYERGIQDGKAMFWFINPSGSTGRAIEVVDSVAAKVDPLVEKAIQDGMKAAEKLAKDAPGYAREARQMVLDYAQKHGLTPKQLETIGVPKGYLQEAETEALTSRMEAYGESAESKTAHRGDKDPKSRFNEKGDPKAYIDEEGDLSPVDPNGLYKGRKVELYEHINHKFCRHAKKHTPYISFGTTDGVVAKYGNEVGIELDLEKFREAIKKGELPGRRIYEHSEVLDSIANSHYPPRVKKNLTNYAKADKEILIEGVIPARFLRIK